MEVMGLALSEKCLVEEEEKTPKPGEIWFDVPDRTGHQHLVWCKHLPEQLKEAQEKFYELLDKGFRLFAVRYDGKKEERPLLRFDPLAEHVIAIAPIAGG